MTKLLPKFGGPDAPEQWKRLMKNIVPLLRETCLCTRKYQKYELSKDNGKVSIVVAHGHTVCCVSCCEL